MATGFDFSDYKALLAHLLEDRGSLSRLAESIGCQRSHLSRVLSTETHLTPDQALGVAEFFAFSSSETELFLAQVDLARASTSSMKKRLAQQIKKLRAENENLSQRLQKAELSSVEQQVLYYSSWLWSALHIGVSIRELQTTSALAEKLNAPPALIASMLDQLENFGLVKRRNNRWEFTSTAVHLPRHSPFISLHHANWRERAVQDARITTSDAIHYTVVQSISRKDFEEVKAMLLKFIDQYNRVAAPSAEEELVALTCDFFRV